MIQISLKIVYKNTTLVDISFDIKKRLALVGESGSGKTLTLKALLGMVPSSMEFEIDIDAPFKLIRGKSVILVPQNPFTSLSPMSKIKEQFLQNIDKIESFLEMVELPKEIANRFPNELSGGQLQRVIIAIALSYNPKLLLLDEPTTALDGLTTKNIITLLKKIQEKFGFYILFVSHELNTVSMLCDEVVVLKDGNIVEYGNLNNILKNPSKEYTKELIEADFAKREFRR